MNAEDRERRARQDAALLDSARAHWGYDKARDLMAMCGVSSQPKDGIWSPEDRRVVTAIVLCGQRR